MKIKIIRRKLKVLRRGLWKYKFSRMRAVKTNHILLMFTGKIQTNSQIARFFVQHKRRAKITMNLHWNWFDMRLQKCIGPIEEGDKLMQK